MSSTSALVSYSRAESLVILNFEYVTFELGTSFLIFYGFPLSAGHGPLNAPGFDDPCG